MKMIKKLLSAVLSAAVIAAVFSAVGMTANAAGKFNVQKQQYNVQCSLMNFYGEQIAFAAYGGGPTELHYSASDYHDDTVIYTTFDDLSHVSVRGQYIYFINAENNALMRIKNDGTGLKRIVKYTERQNLTYIFSGQKIVYRLTDYSKNGAVISTDIYTCSLNGDNRKIIVKNVSSGQMYTYKNKLYYIKNSRIYSYAFKTKKNALIKAVPSGCCLIGMENNILYYYKDIDSDDAYYRMSCYRVNVSTKKGKRLALFRSDDPILSLLVSDGTAYITTGTGSGCRFARIENGKPNYRPFRNKYNLCDNQIGYYQNKVLVEDTYDGYVFSELAEVTEVQ